MTRYYFTSILCLVWTRKWCRGIKLYWNITLLQSSPSAKHARMHAYLDNSVLRYDKCYHKERGENTHLCFHFILDCVQREKSLIPIYNEIRPSWFINPLLKKDTTGEKKDKKIKEKIWIQHVLIFFWANWRARGTRWWIFLKILHARLEKLHESLVEK